MLAGVLPTPAVALLALDLGAVVSASHNPPEYNGVKFFDRDGHKLSDEQEEQIEALLDAPERGGGADRPRRRRRRQLHRARPRALRLRPRGHADRRRLRERRLLAGSRPPRSAPSAPRCWRSATSPTDATSTSVAARRISPLLSRVVRENGMHLGIAFDGDGDRMLAVDAAGEVVDGDQILAILALHLGVDLVAVTVMTNLGFHRLMEERGVRVITTPVGDRYVLEALWREGGLLGGEQSGPPDLPARPRDRRRARRGAAALRGGARHDARRGGGGDGELPQVKRNVPGDAELAERLQPEVERLNEELDGNGRVLVRPSGRSPWFGSSPRRKRAGSRAALW